MAKKDWREARSDAYREFKQWALIELANAVIKFGLRDLGGVLEMILHQYRQFEADHPIPKEK